VFELDIEHREIAQKLKYKEYLVASCMNDSDRFVNLIVDKVNAAMR
jgi:ferrochelatase